MDMNIYDMISFSIYKQNIKGGIQESYDLVRTYPKRFSDKFVIAKIWSVLKILSVPVAIVLSTHMGLIEQIMGSLGLMMALIVPRLQNNKHINAIIAPVSFIMCVQSLLLGNYGYAALTGIGAVRCSLMTALPDTQDAQVYRTRMTVVFIVSGLLISASLGVFNSALAFLTMMAMTLGAIASSRINSKTMTARLLYMSANTLNLTYNALLGNMHAVMLESLMAFNHFQSYREQIKNKA